MKVLFLHIINIIFLTISGESTYTKAQQNKTNLLPQKNHDNNDQLPEPISTTNSKQESVQKRATLRPNIVFIIADDLGYNDVGYHGKRMGSIAETPAIDKLAYSGVRLENYYVQPSCTPTRASLMTGKYPIRLGLQLGNIDAIDSTCLPLQETTLPEKLRDLGYVTRAVGKWHLGFSRTACLPTRRGFDSYFGILTGYASYYTRTRLNANTLYDNETVAWGYKDIHSSELYTRRAVHIINNHDKNRPLFLYLSHQAVHGPMEVPKKYQMGYIWKYPQIWRRMVNSKISQSRKSYLGLVKSLDVSVDIVVEALKKRGLWDNTVLVFTSDNGGKGGSGGNNWPLRGKKNTLWEGGIRSVGFVASPLLPPRVRGTVQEGLIHVSDWFPTLVEGVAGGDAEKQNIALDGFNMWKTIKKGRASPRNEILHNILTPLTTKPTKKTTRKLDIYDKLPFNLKIGAAIRQGDWKLVTGPWGHRSGAWQPPPEDRKSIIPMAVFDHVKVHLRLYNIRHDPEEKYNVAMSHPELVMRLLERLRVYDEHSVLPKSSIHYSAFPIGGTGRRAWGPWIS